MCSSGRISEQAKRSPSGKVDGFRRSIVRRFFRERDAIRREEVLQILARFRDLKRDEFGIVRIGIFGSVTREEMMDTSDVDIVVELARPDLLTLVGIKQEMEELLGRPVDVVRYREQMNPFLKHRINREAIYV